MSLHSTVVCRGAACCALASTETPYSFLKLHKSLAEQAAHTYDDDGTAKFMEHTLTGSWFDESSDETWSFFADGTFEQEWHIQGDTHAGTYELNGSELRLSYESGFERTWQIETITATALTWRIDADSYTLKKI